MSTRRALKNYRVWDKYYTRIEEITGRCCPEPPGFVKAYNALQRAYTRSTL